MSSLVNNREQIYTAEIFLLVGVLCYLLCSGLAGLAKGLQRRHRALARMT